MDMIALVNAAGAVPAWGIAVICLVQLVRGAIVPYSALVREVERIAADRDSRLHAKDAEIERIVEERDDWRDAWKDSQGVAATVREQNSQLIGALDPMRKVVAALPQPSEGGDSP